MRHTVEFYCYLFGVDCSTSVRWQLAAVDSLIFTFWSFFTLCNECFELSHTSDTCWSFSVVLIFYTGYFNFHFCWFSTAKFSYIKFDDVALLSFTSKPHYSCRALVISSCNDHVKVFTTPRDTLVSSAFTARYFASVFSEVLTQTEKSENAKRWAASRRRIGNVEKR